MGEPRILRALDRIQPLFGRMGIDYPIMRRVLALKLTLDRRRTTGVAALFRSSKSGSMDFGLGRKNGNAPKPKEAAEDTDGGLRRTLFFYGLYGAISSLFMLAGGTYFFQAGLILAVLLFIMMTAMLSDFSSVMLDVRDKPILHTKPVDARTLGMAKTLHILIYFTQFALALGIVPIAVGIFKNGPVFGLLLLLSLVLGGLLVAVFTAFVYLVVLKLFDGETLKDMINYVQIAMTLFMLVGYQVAIRAMDMSRISSEFHPGWWELAVPPLWYSAGFEWLLNGRSEPLYMVPALMGLIVPLVGAVIFYRCIPAFERSLEKLSGGTSRGGHKSTSRVSRLLANLLCRSKEERAFYVFASAMLAREREFKLKVYPSLGFSLAVPFIFLFSFATAGQGLSSIDYANGVAYLNLYSCAIMIPTLVLTLKFSGSFKGSWIYASAPIGQLGSIYRATLKAAFARLFFPLFMIESVIFTVMFGIRIVPDLIVIAAVAASLFPLTLRITERELPFSLPFPTSDQSGGMKVLGVMLLLGVFAGVHYIVVTAVPVYGVWGLIAASIALNIWAWRDTLYTNK